MSRKPTLPSGLLAKPGAAPIRSAAVEDLPRTPNADQGGNGGGLKNSTVGTTLYLLPSESKRLRRLAIDLDSSLHELVLIGLDRLLAENGQAPLSRYMPANPRKGKKR